MKTVVARSALSRRQTNAATASVMVPQKHCTAERRNVAIWLGIISSATLDALSLEFVILQHSEGNRQLPCGFRARGEKQPPFNFGNRPASYRTYTDRPIRSVKIELNFCNGISLFPVFQRNEIIDDRRDVRLLDWRLVSAAHLLNFALPFGARQSGLSQHHPGGM